MTTQLPPRICAMLAHLLDCEAASDLSVTGFVGWCDEVIVAATAVRATAALAHHTELVVHLRNYLTLAEALRCARYQGSRRSGAIDLTLDDMTYAELLALVEDVR